MVENIGFIGLGSMGSGMAARLVAMDVPLWVYDTRPDACEPLEREGAIVAENVARLGQSCKRIILSLPDVVVVERVLFGEGGLLQSLQPGSDVIDCGTTHPDKTRDIAQRLMEEDVAFLDAPVSGMETRAADGTLTIMVGGDAAAYSRCEPLLKEMGELEKTCALTHDISFHLDDDLLGLGGVEVWFCAADVLVTSDHGFNLGHHMLVQAKMLFCTPPNPALLN
mgnify:CR=1 FL=1